jgi:L-iditol 2-dehydrogenase
MKAYVYGGKGELGVKDIPEPSLTDENAVIKVLAASVCGTDVRIHEHGSDKVTPPRVIGHEVCGTVTGVGKKAKGVRLGSTVLVAPALGCGECRECKSGHTNMCDNLKTIGFNYDGAFEEYMEVPAHAIRMGHVIEVEKKVDPTVAPLAEPVACCVNAQEYLDIRAGDSVLIFGAGFIGCVHAELALMKGAGRVAIAEVSDERLSSAKSLLKGVEFVNSSSVDIEKWVKEHTGGRGADVAITACPSGKAHETALKVAAKRGRVSLFGGIPEPAKGFLDSNIVHYKELSIHGAHASTAAQNRITLGWITSGELEVDKYVSGVYRLDDLEEAFAAIKSGKAMKVIVKP